MRKFLLSLAVVLLAVGVYGYTSSTVPIQAEAQQQQACNGLDVGEVDHNTSVEDRVLTLEGVFCAPNIGYTLESSDISVDGEDVSASVFISSPQGITGPAVTPVKFNASETLEPGEYDLEVRIEVEGRHNISDSSDLVIEGQQRSLMQRIRAFFSGLFR